MTVVTPVVIFSAKRGIALGLSEPYPVREIKWLKLLMNSQLVGGLEHELDFFPIVGMMIQSDFHIFPGGLKPPIR
jgi:hypothetical protein